MTDDHTTTAEQLVADRDDTTAAVVVTTDGEASEIGGHIAATDDHPAQLSLWMLALHIDHVTRSARGAGGDTTHVETAKHALEMLSASYEGGGV